MCYPDDPKYVEAIRQFSKNMMGRDGGLGEINCWHARASDKERVMKMKQGKGKGGWGAAKRAHRVHMERVLRGEDFGLGG